MQKYLVAIGSADTPGTIEVAFEEALKTKFGEERIELTNKHYPDVVTCISNPGCDVVALIKEGPRYYLVTRCRQFSQKRFRCIEATSLGTEALIKLIASKAKRIIEIHDDDHANAQKTEDR